MPAAATPVTAAQIQAVIDTVADPEMPAVSVAQLGMVVDVRVHEAGDEHQRHGRGEPAAAGCRVEVDLVATYSSCPATRMIADDVRTAVEAIDGVAQAQVDFVRHVTWTPQRITAAGREALRRFGIAPPGDDAPLLEVGSTPPPWWEAGEPQAVACPWCGSPQTRRDSAFGPTPCRSTHWCAACRNPFEAVKA